MNQPLTAVVAECALFSLPSPHLPTPVLGYCRCSASLSSTGEGSSPRARSSICCLLWGYRSLLLLFRCLLPSQQEAGQTLSLQLQNLSSYCPLPSVSVSWKSQVHLQDDRMSCTEPSGSSHRNLAVIHLPKRGSPLDVLLMSTVFAKGKAFVL